MEARRNAVRLSELTDGGNAAQAFKRKRFIDAFERIGYGFYNTVEAAGSDNPDRGGIAAVFFAQIRFYPRGQRFG